jgi:hypothetical protein
MSNATPATTAVRTSVWSICVSVRTSTPSRSPGGFSMPSSVGSSPTMIVSVRPNTNPVTIGFDRNSATHARRSSTAPVAIARAAVIAMACRGSPLPMSATSDPDTIATVDAGPTISSREDPRME